jgi:hypothetical protein
MQLSIPQNHFWAGSSCLVNEPDYVYPRNVTVISDILTIKADLGNQIPNKSWMIYMLELFIDRNYVQANQIRSVPLELDLFCQFDEKISFIAVFNGHNQYSFKNILPKIGNSYLREIAINASDRIIIYHLTDLNNRETESFGLSANNMDGNVNNDTKNELVRVIREVKFEPYKHFTGIEWWNKVGNVPYPVRYQVQFSMLRYAEATVSSPDIGKINYKPYTLLTEDKDSLGKPYPVGFENLREMDGCICYEVNSGMTNTGMTFKL